VPRPSGRTPYRKRAARGRSTSIAALRVALASGVLLWTMLLVIADVSDASSSFSTKVTLVPAAAGRGYQLSGRVTSRQAACVGHRTVQLLWRVGRQPFFPSGTVRTSATGRWLMHTVVNLAGQYEVRVLRRRLAKGSCHGATSSVLTLIQAAEPTRDPSVPLQCDPGYAPGHIAGGAEEFCLPPNWNGTYADCAVGAHVRAHYVDKCVLDGRPTVRQ
jgi:hypothetical protein